MRPPSTLLATAVAIALVACGKSSAPPPPHEADRRPAVPSVRAVPAPVPQRVAVIDPVMTPNVAALMRRVETEDVLCRGGYDADGMRACNRRTRILDHLDKLGWCVGPFAKPTSDEDWMKCKEDPGYLPGIYEKPYFTEKEIRDFSAAKRKDDAELRSYGNGRKKTDLETSRGTEKGRRAEKYLAAGAMLAIAPYRTMCSIG